MNINEYKTLLSSQGSNLGQIRKNKSDFLMNQTFTGDPEYKKVYILTKNGWKYEDAKYQVHTTPSILKDAVDYYLQFRPKVHYPIGTYVIVPDDTCSEINLLPGELQNPFLQPVSHRTQWWIIVGRTDANAFVRYNILKCNWEFKWVYDGKVKRCYGCIRNANSYTSGKWTDEYSSSLDNQTAAWIPDTYYTYGDNLESFSLDDTRTIMHEQRFLLSNNIIDPKVYQVTKVVDLTPQGIIKLSIKQDEFNSKRDNLELGICDYYANNGEVRVDIPEDIISDETHVSKIIKMEINSDGELDVSMDESNLLELGKSYYYNVEFSSPGIEPQWKISLSINNNEYSDEEKNYYERLIKINQFDNFTISIKPGKANSLKGKKFILSVSDYNGDYYSSIDLEVAT